MAEAKQGDKVKVHYEGSLPDGSQFDSSKGRDPLEFTLGAGEVIPGFEQAVVGLEVGSSVKVDVPAAQAYGNYREELVAEFPKDKLPEHIEPKEGLILQIRGEGDQVTNVAVKSVSETAITLDGNHPLAGKDLTFDIELVDIVAPA